MDNGIDLHRKNIHVLFAGILCLHVPINIGTFLAVGAPWIGLGIASAVVAGVCLLTLAMASNEAAIRSTFAVGYVATISLLLAGMQGHPWQVDIHMYYFAALALASLYCDWMAIATAAAAVAVHHLVGNYVLPTAIYPGGADLGRVILHAVILVGEAVGLMWMSHKLRDMFSVTFETMNAALAAQSAAERATENVLAAQENERKSAAEKAAFEQQVAADQAAAQSVMARALQRLSEGDLTSRIHEAMPASYQHIQSDFNGAVSKLEETLQGFLSSTVSIDAGTREISESSNDLARRTELQAASLEEAVAALGAVTDAVSKTAAGATNARDVVGSAKTNASRGEDVVRNAVDAMEKIENSSKQISQIIGVIDEIAFQTNLLALNAGVEAARAGEAGRGFAVVASEVRGLAQRSAEAAKEIKGLITTSMSEVTEGVRLVANTGEALRQIAGNVDEINDVVTVIADSAQEQAHGLQEVNNAVGQMDQATQQNAAMAEEATAASVTLSQESGRLAALVRQFKTSQGTGGVASHRATESVTPRPAARGAAIPHARKGKVVQLALPPSDARGSAQIGGGPSMTSASADSKDWKEF